jgi:hypothetical protein
MENERRWFRGSTLLFMVVLLVPTLALNLEFGLRALYSEPKAFVLYPQLPFILRIMVCEFFISQILFAYYLALICDWIIDAGATRHWFQLNLSTSLILMVVMSVITAANVDKFMFNEGYQALALFRAVTASSMLMFFAFGFLMLGATARALDRNVARPWGGKLKTVATPPPNDATLISLYPDRQTQIIGAIPLYLLIIFLGVSMLLMEEVSFLWRDIRLDLPLPSLGASSLSKLFVKHPLLPFMLAVSWIWLYWGWVCKDRRRIFWFNVVVVGLLLFGIVALAFSVITPFFKTSSCILKGTPVATPTGPRPIQDLRIGDKVLSRSSKGEMGDSTVTDIRSADVDGHLVLILSDGVELSCTGEHPIAVGDQWIRAKLLRVGDEVTCHDKIRKLVEIKTVSQPATVYDITVEPHHNFLANGVLVHNALKKK